MVDWNGIWGNWTDEKYMKAHADAIVMLRTILEPIGKEKDTFAKGHGWTVNPYYNRSVCGLIVEGWMKNGLWTYLHRICSPFGSITFHEDDAKVIEAWFTQESCNSNRYHFSMQASRRP